MISSIELTDSLSVSAQPAVADLGALAAQGFKVVVCNRPDHESPEQPTMDEMQSAVEGAGMRFVRYPVNPASFPGEDIEGLGKIFDGEEGKVFAFCRTGTRCTNLWVVSRSADARADAVERARQLGFDLSLASAVLGEL
jgi:sulfide:quinone oxidoreductase